MIDPLDHPTLDPLDQLGGIDDHIEGCRSLPRSDRQPDRGLISFFDLSTALGEILQQQIKPGRAMAEMEPLNL